MLQALLQSGAASTALPLSGMQVGQRADCLVLDAASPALCGVPAAHVLDAHVFSSPGSAPLGVCVGGQWHAHSALGAVAQNYAAALAQLVNEAKPT